MSRLRIALLSAVALALALPSAAPAATPATPLYVSLGDSYATGYQPTAPGVGRATRNGFANQIPGLASKRGYRLKLVNFGCGGDTSASLLQRKVACRGPAVDGPSYTGRTQIAAAERYLRAHRGAVTLVTISIGGNDVTFCARGVPDPVKCVIDAVEGLKTNLGTIVRRVRAAAGPEVRIVGTTYPDVILGRYLTGRQADQDLARLSVVAFRSVINPALKAAYESVKGRLVDVTAATGAYGSFDQTTTFAPYGAIPVPVATVCRLTYFCQFGDIHARTSGYRVIAELVARTLPRRT